MEELREATKAEWWAVWNTCDWATYFQSPEWAEVWSEYTEGMWCPRAEYIRLSTGVVAVLPFVVERGRRSRYRRHLSSPAGTFGGWLSDADVTIADSHLLTSLLQKKRALVWRWNPYAPAAPPSGRSSDDVTHVVDLVTDVADLTRSWSKGHRSAAQKAERAGIQIRCSESQGDWWAYYQLYGKSLARWGDKASTVYTWRLFAALSMASSSYRRLWVAEYEGRAVAGAVIFYGPRHVVYWHGAADDEYFHLRPVHMLIREAMRDARERGLYWFDFNPSGGHVGVKSFKKGFGARELPAPLYRQERSSADWPRRIRARVLEALRTR